MYIFVIFVSSQAMSVTYIVRAMYIELKNTVILKLLPHDYFSNGQ